MNNNFSKTENRVFDFFINNQEHLNKYTIKTISQKCFCSTMSVHRTIRKLGYSSFNEFINNTHTLNYNNILFDKKYLNFKNAFNLIKLNKKVYFITDIQIHQKYISKKIDIHNDLIINNYSFNFIIINEYNHYITIEISNKFNLDSIIIYMDLLNENI